MPITRTRARTPLLATLGITAVALLVSVGGVAYAAQTGGSRSCTGIRGIYITSSVSASAGLNGHIYQGTGQSGGGYVWATSTYGTGSRTTYSSMKSGTWTVWTTAGSINSAGSGCYYL
ncbi:MAG: hypothetical protein AB7K08_05595 [Microbacteriaceae bacterium]